ncbi:MAG: NAD(P)/FAD-dependent oxidoreductase, partial [Candidatus Omnitrophota bacterium]
DELEIDLPTVQIDPTDKIIMPDFTIYLRAKIEDTIAEFKRCFPKEARNIEKFFEFILNKDFLSVYKEVKEITFGRLLNSFFKDYKLKAVFSLLLGNLGLSAKTAFAVPAIILFREYILDSGHYPIGGIQAFPDKLVEKLNSLNGEVILSKKVVKIITTGSEKEVVLDDGRQIPAKVIVSNADATETFKELLDIKVKEAKRVDKMKASPSLFLVYLGLKGNLENTLKEKTNIWYSSSYDIDRMYSYMANKVINKKPESVACSFPSMHDPSLTDKEKFTATLFIFAPFKTKEFWEKNKLKVGQRMINKAAEIIPRLKESIDIKIHGTPYDFYRYTANKNGSFVGWLSDLKQTGKLSLLQRTSVKNLYLTGHWCTMGYLGYGGIPKVAFSGKKAAMLILRGIS